MSEYRRSRNDNYYDFRPDIRKSSLIFMYFWYTSITEILTCVYMAQNIYIISAPSFTYASPTLKNDFICIVFLLSFPKYLGFYFT